METIFQGLLDLAGVNAAMVFDGAGNLVGQRGRALYDAALCQQVGSMLAKAVDSIQLQQEDWESVTAQFADGKLLLRNLGAFPGGRSYVLAVVADGTLNASFATVAIRVAANKLKKALEGDPSGRAAASGLAGSSPAIPPPLPASASAAAGSQPGSGSRPVLASSGLSWSKVSSSGLSSSLMVADPASSDFLTRCVKQLARRVGPMAKVYVEEAVRRVSPDVPFSLALGKALAEDLGAQIEDPKDRAVFLADLAGAKTK